MSSQGRLLPAGGCYEDMFKLAKKYVKKERKRFRKQKTSPMFVKSSQRVVGGAAPETFTSCAHF